MKADPSMAELKAFRRKLQNQIKRGVKVFGPSALAYTERNIERNELVQSLNRDIDCGGGLAVAARKAKKALCVDWQNRVDDNNLTEYWNEAGKRRATGKCDVAAITKSNKAKRGM